MQSFMAKKARLGLPGYYYFSDEIFALEMQTLWCNTWQFVGRESELQNPGDYLTCIVGDQSLILVKTTSRKLQAFHNVCLHRGSRLLEGKGNCNSIRCPYHAWSYNLEGNLVGVPQEKLFPNLDKSTVHLAKARVDTWGGFIFVNPELEAESLRSYLAGFPAYLEQYEYAWKDLQKVDFWSHEEPVNWKFLVENYLDAYHMSTVHAQSIKFFDTKSIQVATTGYHYQASVYYSAEESVKDRRAFSGKSEKRGYYGFVFPNIMFNTAEDSVLIFRLFPLTPTSTRFELLVYQTEAQMKAFPYDSDKYRSEVDRILQEDFAAVRLLQASVRSKAYRVLQLAEELEAGIVHFHKVLSEYFRLLQTK